MSKIIPVFYLPKEYPEDIKLLAEGLLANDGQSLKSAVLWLQGKLLAHSGPKAGSPMSDTTIKNYLAGFYVLDLFKASAGNASAKSLRFYSDAQPQIRASVPIQAKIEIINPLQFILNSSTIESFSENLTRLCFERSRLVIDYNYDRRILQEKYGLEEKPKPAKLQELLKNYCGYSHVGHPGLGYLDLFYKEKVQIDNYLKLLQFIRENYREMAQQNLGLIPLANVFARLKQISDYREEDFKRYLIQLKLTNRIELRTTKSQLAKNMGIELIDIQGIKYGFIKIVESAVIAV
jgi:flagellin-specific chaperone FliS